MNTLAVKFLRNIESTSRKLANTLSQKKVVFLHIPKCGGTSISSAIASAIHTGWEGYVDPIRTRKLAQLILGDQEQAEGSSLLFHIRQAIFFEFIQEEKPFIFGHFPVIYDCLINPKDYVFVTVLRYPCERFISQFKYSVGTKYNSLKQPLNTDEINLIWNNYIESKLAAFHANILSAYLDERGSYDLGSQESLARAMRNLEYFEVVGFLEKLDDFSENIYQAIGKKITIEVKNKSEYKLSSYQQKEIFLNFFDEQKLLQINELCRQDLKLYEFAQSQNKI
ncbi:hypothetical protein [Rivularia sp. UHCC 0363]|uniref:hypothetical protein n=1 Tax=Rivularia sp. UHCC 0363 TaxID=3110244 RepID=UPI002B1EEEF0|nr:hypothetical protein [Rivularia sp. UHCC 0363]MEA5596129.1 hypothetical protein [Rivularia sp. UHCC 0363]